MHCFYVNIVVCQTIFTEASIFKLTSAKRYYKNGNQPIYRLSFSPIKHCFEALWNMSFRIFHNEHRSWTKEIIDLLLNKTQRNASSMKYSRKRTILQLIISYCMLPCWNFCLNNCSIESSQKKGLKQWTTNRYLLNKKCLTNAKHFTFILKKRGKKANFKTFPMNGCSRILCLNMCCL